MRIGRGKGGPGLKSVLNRPPPPPPPFLPPSSLLPRCRVRLQAQLEDATGQLSSAAMAQVDLILQRDGLTQQLAEAEGRAGALVEHVRGVYEALAMDTALRVRGVVKTSPN